MIAIIIENDPPMVCGPFPSHVGAKMWWDEQKMFDRERCKWRSVMFFHIMPFGYEKEEK